MIKYLHKAELYYNNIHLGGIILKYLEYSEKKQHGSADFPIQYYRLTPVHPQYVMPLHWHREFEMIRVISGCFSAYLDNVEYRLSTGDMLLVQSGSLHRGQPEDCVYECAVFDLNMLRKHQNDITGSYILPIINHAVSVNCFYHSDDNMLAAAINSLFAVLKLQSPYYELEVYSRLYQIFALLYAGGSITAKPKSRQIGRQNKVIMELLDWIDANYTEQITLSDLSKVSGMNEKYLCRFFKEYTAHTPIDYINSLRIESACHELISNGHSITEAALESGFNDLSYFSKLFKKYKGYSPRQYLNATAQKKKYPGYVSTT